MKEIICKVIFSLEAICSILNECYRGGRAYETGGILIGPKSHSYIVTNFIPSSIHAEREFATYYQSENDAKILTKKIKPFEEKGYCYKGDLHSHPSGMVRPSVGDLACCADTLLDPDYGVNDNLITCIVTENHNEDSFPIFPYIINLNQRNEIVMQKAQIKVLPKRCIKECIIDNFEQNQIGTGGNNESNNNRHIVKKPEQPRQNRPARLPRERNNSNSIPKKTNSV